MKFDDANALLAAVRNIAQFVGRPIDDERPFLDARLPAGFIVPSPSEDLAGDDIEEIVGEGEFVTNFHDDEAPD